MAGKKKNKVGPVPAMDPQELAKWYAKLEEAVKQVGKEMPPDIRTFFARSVEYSAFMQGWIAETGEHTEEG